LTGLPFEEVVDGIYHLSNEPDILRPLHVPQGTPGFVLAAEREHAENPAWRVTIELSGRTGRGVALPAVHPSKGAAGKARGVTRPFH
jgi:hypothetical protein